jgi:DnaJ-class molecular chaperone
MTLATCPKCNGTGYLSSFAHIANGACFGCHGTGKVEVSEQTATAIAASVKPSKEVALDGYGKATISRDAVGFTACLSRGQAWFSIHAGRVMVDAVSDVLAGQEARIAASLQAAYRAA